MFTVELVEVGDVDHEVMEYLAASIHDGFSLKCTVRSGVVDVRPFHDQRRGQHHSTEILAKLLELGPAQDRKILGVTDVDLFVPIFTFVFGEAQLRGPAALVSLHRLRQEFYGLPPAEDLFYVRAEKEALHELGHTFGLVHCASFDCVMRFSNSIEEVDMKTSSFCDSCSAVLRERCGEESPPVARSE